MPTNFSILNKFKAAIDEINQQVGQNTEKNNSLIQENVQLTNKLKSLLEQYEVREQVRFNLFKFKYPTFLKTYFLIIACRKSAQT